MSDHDMQYENTCPHCRYSVDNCICDSVAEVASPTASPLPLTREDIAQFVYGQTTKVVTVTRAEWDAVANKALAALTLQEALDRLAAALKKYGQRGYSDKMCEHSKHSNYPCTCGYDEAIKECDK